MTVKKKKNFDLEKKKSPRGQNKQNKSQVFRETEKMKRENNRISLLLENWNISRKLLGRTVVDKGEYWRRSAKN